MPKEYVTCFKYCYDFQVPLKLFPTVPEFWLEFGENATLPFVKASNYGILGLNSDLLLLTDYAQMVQ